ncbi:kinase C delta type [Brachionus plicatilis]|uniref:Kinase C delta type n=1 Tax=Brachionus plicatilis TaxID=10195 RepID=A0A3M7RSV2_BRAPC|nr:kinase C delta type [Brachionus plicatilis]
MNSKNGAKSDYASKTGFIRVKLIEHDPAPNINYDNKQESLLVSSTSSNTTSSSTSPNSIYCAIKIKEMVKNEKLEIQYTTSYNSESTSVSISNNFCKISFFDNLILWKKKNSKKSTNCRQSFTSLETSVYKKFNFFEKKKKYKKISLKILFGINFLKKGSEKVINDGELNEKLSSGRFLLVQKKPTFYPKWSSCFDCHVYSGRCIQFIAKSSSEKKSIVLGEITLGIEELANKANNASPKKTMSEWQQFPLDFLFTLDHLYFSSGSFIPKCIKNTEKLISYKFISLGDRPNGNSLLLNSQVCITNSF